MAQKHLEQINFKHLVVIAQGNNRVMAPIPEGFGVGIGSEISSPFSGMLQEGNIANLVRVAAGISARTGLFTRKIYMGPDQPDFTLDLKFEAYYDAFDEVVHPIMTLQRMAAGTNHDGENTEIAKKLNQKISAVSEDAGKVANRIAKMIRYFKAPTTVRVLIGDVITLGNCYISSITPSYGNVLDSEGNPMYADVSVTFTLVDPLTKYGISDMHKYVVSGRVNRK